MAEPTIHYLGDVQRLQLAPGDVLVIRCDRPLSQEMAERLIDHVKEIVGTDRKVLVLDKGLEIGVLAPSSEG